eukprot:CAMPEP_0202374152 /NCGR_PEP_ID=MMETSP1127-20130417/5040_1 /ASSEMBLY_ACC=CAM_ASM_000462 /TAXON_ID=3047 /ORGANISM="Dunaliella tertiolecta, Strain CCMP1320" /LENGTH=543 /DNA_ID=CAMNT_0048971237 /DNA_START=53 /DNA_END=1681 /DNA_ORIENTATION=+
MHGSLAALLLQQQLYGQRVGLGAASHDELIRRLKPKLSFPEAPSNSIASVCSWSQDGSSLAHASDGCVKIWDTAGAMPRAVCSVDTGHPTINDMRFFPETSNSKLVTVSSDRQARVIDLERMAIRPFSCHKAKIRAVAVVSPNVFLTGCEDGVVRQLDVREQPLVIDSSALRDAYCAESVVVEQRSERTKDRVGVNSIAVDPLKPMFATGGGDPLVRVYDARMMSRGRPMPWVLAYVPSPVAAACSSRDGQPRQRHVTSVAYDHTGHRLLASYSKDSIYSFSVKDDCFFPSTLPRELGGPSPRVPSSAYGLPGDITGPGSRAALGNTETLGRGRSRATFGNTVALGGEGSRGPLGTTQAPAGAEGRSPMVTARGSAAAAAAASRPPRQSGSPPITTPSAAQGPAAAVQGTAHSPDAGPSSIAATPAAATPATRPGPNTGVTAPPTFPFPRARDSTAPGVGEPPGISPNIAGIQAQGEQRVSASHSDQVQGAHNAGARHGSPGVQGAGLLQRAFTPFGQALYRRWVQLVQHGRQQQQQQQQQQQ